MEVIVGYESALDYWRCVGPQFAGNTRQRRSATNRARRVLAACEKPVLAGGNRRPGGCRLPLHVLVGSAEARVRSATISSHVCSLGADADSAGKLPSLSFVRAGKDFLVASPELCFLQLATVLPVERLIQLGFEICGTYSIQPGYPAANREEALTSKARLQSFAERATDTRGRKKALRAVRYLADGSASPMETILAMLLSLPYAMGGYGIKLPQMNYRVDVPDGMRKRADRSYCFCDLCWPESRLCLEYDSALYHLDPERQESDARRRNTLVSLGFTVMTVSPHQLTDSGAFNRLAHQVADHVGKRLRYVDPGFTRSHLALRKLLFAEGL